MATMQACPGAGGRGPGLRRLPGGSMRTAVKVVIAIPTTTTTTTTTTTSTSTTTHNNNNND